MSVRVASVEGTARLGRRIAARSLASSSLRPPKVVEVSAPVGGPKPGEQVHHLSFTLPKSEDIPETAGSEAAFRALNARFSQPHKTFGLDHRSQYLVEEESGEELSRKPFYRLSQEPLILSNWRRIATIDFTSETAAKFASLLCSKEVKVRDHPMWARGPTGHFVFFDDVAAACTWLPDLERIRAMRLPPLAEAVVVYCRVVIAHPFTDGNGRFARAMFYGPLARAGVLSSPCLSLGTAFNLRREEIARATAKLAETRNWSNYIGTMFAVLEVALQMALRD